MNYRSDIDGLRSIAVLSVITYHLSFHLSHNPRLVAPGGFVGVDVFFVISGFLITRTIYEDIGRGAYSAAEFYGRRVRRIFPALFVVLFFILSVAFFKDSPLGLLHIGTWLVSAIFFVSNIFFYNSTGYFDPDLQANPVLHTWSLSIEEQFYIFFPTLVFALRGVPHSARIKIMLLICAASLAYASWKIETDQAAAFYLVQSRCWELLLGSVLAIGNLPKPSARWQIELLGLLGLGLILGSVETISTKSAFPGLWALPACLGAAAILHSGGSSKSCTERVLGSAPLRFLGKISYSLYLWHWPLIVFFRDYREPNDTERVLLIELSVALAYLSWRFVEQPFRKHPYRVGAFTTVAAAAGAMAFGSALVLVARPASALIWPSGVEVDRLLAYQDYGEMHMRAGTCFLPSKFDTFERYKGDVCLAVDPDKRNFLIVGDSHAAHLWLGLQTVFKDANFLQATASGCKPVLQATGAERCTRLMDFIFATFLPRTHLDGIILSAKWNSTDLDMLRATALGLRRYADRIYVFGPIEQYERPLPQILAQGVGREESELAAKYRLAWPSETDRVIATGLAGDPVRYVSVYRTLCPSQCVLWAKKGVPLQFDYGHLTAEGSIFLASQLDPGLFQSKAESVGPP